MATKCTHSIINTHGNNFPHVCTLSKLGEVPDVLNFVIYKRHGANIGKNNYL